MWSLERRCQYLKMNYQQLCDVVYEEKGYSSDGIPLPETLNRFGLLDEQAKELLSEYNMVLKDRLLSN